MMNVGQRLCAEVRAENNHNYSPDRRAARLIQQFEKHGGGWFWETFSDGSLAYISAHVGDTFESPLHRLIGSAICDLVRGNDDDTNDIGHSGRSLSFYLSSKLGFRDLVVRADTAKEVWWSMSGEPIHDPEGRFLGFSGIAVDLTGARRSEIALNKLAHFDSLTGLANRGAMKTALDNALLSARHAKRTCAVILLDLDDFKAVNDTFGHPIGDELLKQVASRLTDCVGTRAQAGRLGGDQFQVVFADVGSRHDLAEIAERIIAGLSRPYIINGRPASIGVSIGIAVSDLAADPARDLVREADIALYAAKAAGKRCYRFFSVEMEALDARRRALQADLQDALVLDQFEVMYQPSVCVRTETVTGFEALVRWTHPDRGAVSPSLFIPLAEECGAIHAIGEWVLRTACITAASWTNQAKVAVNVSPLQFCNRALPTVVASALSHAGLPANRLELEITEGVLMRADESIFEIIHTLKRMGVRLALDDFGTGYSSLGYIQKVPFDKIKIDQSFIRGASLPESKNAHIIKAVVDLALAFGMETTAEGVETQDELALVRDLGCTFVQGYIYGKPMPAQEARKCAGSDHEPSANGFMVARPERRSLIRSGLLRIGSDQHAVRIRNISAGGALVECSTPVDPGNIVELDLTTCVLEAEVRWARSNSHGLRFLAPFDMTNLPSIAPTAKSPEMLTPTYLVSHDHPSSPLAIDKTRFTKSALRT